MITNKFRLLAVGFRVGRCATSASACGDDKKGNPSATASAASGCERRRTKASRAKVASADGCRRRSPRARSAVHASTAGGDHCARAPSGGDGRSAYGETTVTMAGACPAKNEADYSFYVAGAECRGTGTAAAKAIKSVKGVASVTVDYDEPHGLRLRRQARPPARRRSRSRSRRPATTRSSSSTPRRRTARSRTARSKPRRTVAHRDALRGGGATSRPAVRLPAIPVRLAARESRRCPDCGVPNPAAAATSPTRPCAECRLIQVARRRRRVRAPDRRPRDRGPSAGPGRRTPPGAIARGGPGGRARRAGVAVGGRRRSARSSPCWSPRSRSRTRQADRRPQRDAGRSWPAPSRWRVLLRADSSAVGPNVATGEPVLRHGELRRWPSRSTGARSRPTRRSSTSQVDLAVSYHNTGRARARAPGARGGRAPPPRPRGRPVRPRRRLPAAGPRATTRAAHLAARARSTGRAEMASVIDQMLCAVRLDGHDARGRALPPGHPPTEAPAPRPRGAAGSLRPPGASAAVRTGQPGRAASPRARGRGEPCRQCSRSFTRVDVAPRIDRVHVRRCAVAAAASASYGEDVARAPCAAASRPSSGASVPTSQNPPSSAGPSTRRGRPRRSAPSPSARGRERRRWARRVGADEESRPSSSMVAAACSMRATEWAPRWTSRRTRAGAPAPPRRVLGRRGVAQGPRPGRSTSQVRAAAIVSARARTSPRNASARRPACGADVPGEAGLARPCAGKAADARSGVARANATR